MHRISQESTLRWGKTKFQKKKKIKCIRPYIHTWNVPYVGRESKNSCAGKGIRNNRNQSIFVLFITRNNFIKEIQLIFSRIYHAKSRLKPPRKNFSSPRRSPLTPPPHPPPAINHQPAHARPNHQLPTHSATTQHAKRANVEIVKQIKYGIMGNDSLSDHNST